MKALIVTISLLVPGSAYGQELAAFYGKGVSSNPNADMSAYTLSWKSGRIFGVPANMHIITGEAYGEEYPQKDLENAPWPGQPYVYYGGGARAFKFLGIGKGIDVSYRAMFCTVNVGAAVFSRTADVAQYSIAPYNLVACGVQFKSYTLSLGRFGASKTGLSDPWTGKDYDAPAFQGFRVSISFDLTPKNRR